jgi:hypothetical protein
MLISNSTYVENYMDINKRLKETAAATKIQLGKLNAAPA